MSGTSLPPAEPNHHPPIPGRVIDPPPRAREEAIERVTARNQTAGTIFLAFQRFTYARGMLLAAGTSYYLLIATFALVALGYGITAWIGADWLADLITEGLNSAFPGLIGADGVDAEALRSSGQAFSIAGSVALLYSGTGAVIAAGHSLHMIYGAPLDPRNIVVARLRALGWMLALGPLILVSFASSTVLAAAAGRVDGPLEIIANAGVQLGGYVFTLLLDFLIMWIMLATLGGIRPGRWPLLIGATVGAVAVSILKAVAGLIVAWSVARPQFGAFAAPVTVLFILLLQTLALYAAASVTAGIAEAHPPDEAPADDTLTGHHT